MQPDTAPSRTQGIRYRHIHALPIPLFIEDCRKRFIDCNQAFSNLTGTPLRDIQGRSASELWIETSGILSPGRAVRPMENGGCPVTQYAIRNARGQTISALCHRYFQHDAEQPDALFLGLLTQIPSPAAGAYSGEFAAPRYKLMADHAHTWLYWIGPDAKLIYISPSCESYTGYTADEFMADAQLLLDIVHPEDREFVARHMRSEPATSRDEPLEFRIIDRSGRLRWFSHYCRSIYNEKRTFLGCRISNQEITEQKLTEIERDSLSTSLQNTSAMLDTVLDAIPDVIGIQDPHQHIIGFNRGGYDLLNTSLSEAHGRKCYELMGRDSQCEACPAVEARQTRKAAKVEKFHKSLDKWIDVRTYPILDEQGNISHIIEHIRDITKEKNTEKQLIEAQKFEAIGTLAGGIAHDFNNLLMAIQGHASLMAAEQSLDPNLMGHIRSIEEHIHSATDLTKQLLGFAQGGKYEVCPVNINDLVQESATMYGRTRRGIRIVFGLAHPSPVVAADRTQIEQVLLNLYVNAWQAMADNGELRLKTAFANLDQAFCDPFGLQPGRYARISVSDTGIGISPAIRDRIFDPFFTTKDKGRGTGLGLASAYGIIKNHSGIISVQSEVGRGSTFDIYLPVTDQPAVQHVTPSKKQIKGTETVLLVDDETMVLEVGQAMLERLGYQVLASPDGEHAIATLAARGDAIDLVILDLIMPGMDGGQVFDQIRKLQPQTPVILCSGYSIDGQAGSIMERGCNGFIQKPFDLSELSQYIRKVLDP